MTRLTPLILGLTLACGSPSPVDTDAPPQVDTDVEDTDAPAWKPPPAGTFTFLTADGPAPGEHWELEADYYPASEEGRPGVVILPSPSQWWLEAPCGREQIPDHAIRAFTDRDWSVIVPDTVGCSRSHVIPDRFSYSDGGHRANTLIPLTQKLKLDGYGPMTIVAGSRAVTFYQVRSREPDVPPMNVGVQWGPVPLPTVGPEPGEGYDLSDTRPMPWLLLFAGGPDSNQAEWLFHWNGGPYPEWTPWYDIRDVERPFMDTSPDLWVRIADWLEPHFEAAMEG